MAQRKIWITWMAKEGGEGPEAVIRALGENGLDPSGAKWTDDLKNFAWSELADALVSQATADVWLIACDKTSLEKPSNRYALSLITAILQENRGFKFPIIMLGIDFAPDSDSLPTLLKSLQIISKSDPAWAAKIVARTFTQNAAAPPDFRITVRANSMFGQWFEVGPRDCEWQGVMFGASEDGKITHHAVGPKGVLPERTVLEYQIQNMTANVAGNTINAWAVQNTLGPEDSYYVKVDGAPQTIVFGGHPGSDQAEVTVLTLS